MAAYRRRPRRPKRARDLAPHEVPRGDAIGVGVLGLVFLGLSLGGLVYLGWFVSGFLAGDLPSTVGVARPTPTWFAAVGVTIATAYCLQQTVDTVRWFRDRRRGGRRRLR